MALSRDADSVFSALGAGKLDGMENMLIQAPEEEGDFDILNDETFGDLGDADFDWEDEHERLAEELEGASFFGSRTQDPSHGKNITRDSGFLTMDRGHASIVQDDLEQSLTRLVVEDGDNKNFDVNGQPIPGALRRSHLDELFGPNSPPGYLDLESLNSKKNIWGSPSADSPFQRPVNNTLQALFASAKQAVYRDIPGVIQDPRAASLQHAPAMPLPSEMPTLAEIENSMLARESNKPQVLTAEELERQLRGEPPLPTDYRQPSFTSAMAVPPVGTSVAFRKQPSGQVPGGLSPRVLNGESSPINIIAPQARALQSLHNQGSPIQSAASPSPSPSPAFPPGMVPPPGLAAQSPRMMSPYNPTMFMANRMMGNAMARPPPTHMPPPNIGSPFGSPYGSPSAAALASRSHYHQQQYHHHHQHNRQTVNPRDGGRHMDHRNGGGPGNQHFDNRYDNMNVYRSPGQHGHFQRHHHQDMYTTDNNEAEDEYAGLMTKKEKDWIIKIQLFQLQTDNPYLDDYYFTYHTLKKKAADRNRQEGKADSKDNEPELLIPNMTKIEPRTYTPAQFEGSLGRLTAASVHNPRQIIDVCRTVSPTGEESGKKNVSKELRRYRQLLMDIEKGFNIILDIDDIEKKVLALPDENRLPLFEERLEKIKTVYDYFMQDDSLKNFVATLQVRKGRKLLARLMPMLGKVQWLSIVTVLLSHLPVLIKKDQDEEGLQVLMAPLSRYLTRCDLECLVHFATILQKHPKQNEEGLGLLLHNSFGISLLCCLIKAGEDYFKTTSPVDIDNQLKTQWAQFIEEFVESLESVPKESLAWPDRHQPQVGEHVDRFISNKVLGGVEDKLAHFSKPKPSEEVEPPVTSQNTSALL
ncbi:protein PAT1 homolog 1-like [Elysia marginata]|uniref:Protein PAT1 homolog 1-like n=1 Tax=Elysia marginata TaxID=1093978 RepID=A0AAV4ESD1_9GAST|nr:protein PAT1 homolog 1-like [Elysia marginata]